jgi:hypothetical protein
MGQTTSQCLDACCNFQHLFARCGCSSMVELLLPKQVTRVRFPSPAPMTHSAQSSDIQKPPTSGGVLKFVPGQQLHRPGIKPPVCGLISMSDCRLTSCALSLGPVSRPTCPSTIILREALSGAFLPCLRKRAWIDSGAAWPGIECCCGADTTEPWPGTPSPETTRTASPTHAGGRLSSQAQRKAGACKMYTFGIL